VRIDKYIWCIRLCKTRSIASKACAAEKIRLNGEFIKPSKTIKVGDIIELKTSPSWRSFRVKDLPKSRLGAKLVPDYAEETTSEEVLEEIRLVQLTNAQNRSFGIFGRPTKRHRRDLDKFIGD